MIVGLSSLVPAFSQEPEFGENSAEIQNRYMFWTEGLILNYSGYGPINDVTVKTTVGGVEMVDGIACRKVVTDRSNDRIQHYWLAQDTLGNVWQLRNLDELTNEFHEEDVLYMPTFPQRFERYDLWDITYASNYLVGGTTARVVTPVQTYENCVQFNTDADGIGEFETFAPLVGLVESEIATSPRGGFRLSSIENFNPPEEPFVSRQPISQNIVYGTGTTLSFHVVSEKPGIYQWYVGESGDTSVSITGKTSGTFETPIQLESINYWVRAIIDGQFVDSETAILTNVPEKVGPQLRGLGSNGWGQYGIGNNTDPPPADRIRSGGALSMSAGLFHSLFVTLDGTLWGMGRNTDAELGQGTLNNFLSSPVVIDTNVTQCFAGANLSFYIKSDNTLWGVGQNEHGQLGDGTTERKTLPVMIDSDVVDVEPANHPGFNHTLYLKSDGTLMGMGSNTIGQLNAGNSISHLTPIVVDTDVIQFSAGIGFSLYIKSDDRLYGVGSNRFGQLGDGTFENRRASILMDTDVAYATGGNNQSYYFKKNGDLYAMGTNIPGHGPETGTPVLFDSGVVKIDPGYVQSGWYSKAGNVIYGLDDKEIKFTGINSYSIGGSHTLYLSENTFALSPVQASIERDGIENYLVTFQGVNEGSQEGFLLSSSQDLDDWITHPFQQKSISGSKLTFVVPGSSAPAPHFFQILSTGQ